MAKLTTVAEIREALADATMALDRARRDYARSGPTHVAVEQCERLYAKVQRLQATLIDKGE